MLRGQIQDYNSGLDLFIFVLMASKKGLQMYGGQLLIDVGRDPNDQYFPLAFGIVETECRASWK